MSALNTEVDRGILAAITWCRLGSSKTPEPWPTDSDFHRAEQLGFLRHDPTWHATPQGEGVLVAVGLLEGAAAPELVELHVLWARPADDLRPPQMVAAFPDGLVEAWPEVYADQRRDAEAGYRAWGFDVLEFFTSVEHVPRPPLPDGLPCPDCEGRGCDDCNRTGRRVETRA